MIRRPTKLSCLLMQSVTSLKISHSLVYSVVVVCNHEQYAIGDEQQYCQSSEAAVDLVCGQLQTVAVAIAKLMYASNTWWGLSNTNDKQKIFAFIHRCICTGFCSLDLADFHDLYISSDEKLFNKILTRPNHILRTLLPPPTAQNYSLRNRPHNRQLPDRISQIMDSNFTVRKLYHNMYRLLYI